MSYVFLYDYICILHFSCFVFLVSCRSTWNSGLCCTKWKSCFQNLWKGEALRCLSDGKKLPAGTLLITGKWGSASNCKSKRAVCNAPVYTLMLQLEIKFHTKYVADFWSVGTHAVNMLQYKFSLQLFSKDMIKMNSVLCEGILVL